MPGRRTLYGIPRCHPVPPHLRESLAARATYDYFARQVERRPRGAEAASASEVFPAAEAASAPLAIAHAVVHELLTLPQGAIGEHFADVFAVLVTSDWSAFPERTPNVAFREVVTHLGPEAAGRIWYDALRRLGRRARLRQCADATVASAAELFGDGSVAQEAVCAAWKAVGIDAGPRAEFFPPAPAAELPEFA